MNEQDFCEELTRAVEDERSRPGYRVQSVAESSFDAWIKFWRRTPNKIESESDYYIMGSYVCMVLDLMIRNESENKHTLDDVLRAMYERFPLDRKGYTNEDFQSTCEEFSGNALSDFFEAHVYGTKPIDWEKYYLHAGLKLSKMESKTPAVSAGLIPEKSGDRIVIAGVLEGSPADRARLIKGDEIIAFDRERCPLETLEKKLKSMKTGDSAAITVFRSNSIMQFTVKLDETKAESYSVAKVEKPSDLQRMIYEKWLNVKW
jgi:predicted metalloprotease with PDZ domain